MNKLEKRKVSIILFIKHNKILLQNRKETSKHGEEYGFFGGKIEGDETPEQAIKREIKEELHLNLTNYQLFKTYHQIIPEINREVTRHVYLAHMPDINKLKVSEGKPALMNFEDSVKLKMIPGDIELLKEIFNHLSKTKRA